MSIIGFLLRVIALRVEIAFSVTSWFRTEMRNREKGGAAESLHLAGLAVDIVLDTPTYKEFLLKRARRYGLVAIDEGDHVHLQAGS